MRTGNVMLRFPGPNPVTREGLFERVRLCADAQRQYDRGQDITVPHGVEIIVAQPGMVPA
jgi:hypothetical protein